MTTVIIIHYLIVNTVINNLYYLILTLLLSNKFSFGSLNCKKFYIVIKFIVAKRSGSVSILSFFQKKIKSADGDSTSSELTFETPNDSVSKLLAFTTIHLY